MHRIRNPVPSLCGHAYGEELDSLVESRAIGIWELWLLGLYTHKLLTVIHVHVVSFWMQTRRLGHCSEPDPSGEDFVIPVDLRPWVLDMAVLMSTTRVSQAFIRPLYIHTGHLQLHTILFPAGFVISFSFMDE